MMRWLALLLFLSTSAFADAPSTIANDDSCDAALLQELRSAFSSGTISRPDCAIVKNVGGAHNDAAGYATIDVVANRNANSPLSEGGAAETVIATALPYTFYDLYTPGAALRTTFQHFPPRSASGDVAGWRRAGGRQRLFAGVGILDARGHRPGAVSRS